MAVFIPVITISTIVGSLISMIFRVFFSLVLFIAYDDNFILKDAILNKEVLS